MTETGYDLAVLMRPAGEARFANVRKLMRLAAEFEAREGRDLRGLLDFLAARAESRRRGPGGDRGRGPRRGADHDRPQRQGARVRRRRRPRPLAQPARRGAAAAADPRPRAAAAGRACSCAGSARGSINLYDYARAAARRRSERDAEEGLRLFHVAATRARERLILSGVVKPEPGRETKPGTPVVERLVEALEVDRDADATRRGAAAGAAPGPRRELRALRDRGPRQPALARARRRADRRRAATPPPSARSARARRRWSSAARRSSPAAPSPTPRSPPTRSAPTASTWSACSASASAFALSRIAGQRTNAGSTETRDGSPSAREERSARGAAVHALLEWSQANGWREPSAELARRHAARRRPRPGAAGPGRGAARRRCATGSAPPSARADRRRRDAGSGPRCRSCSASASTVLRGSIDLLVEREGAPPLVVDYKTDRLDGADPAEHAARYEIQRTIYALAVAEACGAAEVEVAYVFLERPEEPALAAARPGRDGGRPRAPGGDDRPDRRAASSRSPPRAARPGTSAAAARRSGASARVRGCLKPSPRPSSGAGLG